MFDQRFGSGVVGWVCSWAGPRFIFISKLACLHFQQDAISSLAVMIVHIAILFIRLRCIEHCFLFIDPGFVGDLIRDIGFVRWFYTWGKLYLSCFLCANRFSEHRLILL